MGTCNELEAVNVVELSSDLVAKEPACATWADSPRLDIFGIAPHQVAKSTLVRNLLGASHHANLIDGPDLGAQATVHTEYLAIYDGGENEEIEHLTACFPHRRIAVLLLALLVEAIDLGDLSGLVVATNENDAVRVPGCALATCVPRGRQGNLLSLEAHQQRKCLQAEVASVDEVAQEYEAGIGILNGYGLIG